ncbi:MAG: carbohydrate kinase family protein [Flavitalea sp.]
MSQKKIDVLVVGELNIDLIMDKLEQFPQVGKEIIANRMHLTLGSSSAIFASNLSVLGSRVSFCGCVGQDNFADKITFDLSSKGVQVDHIIRSTTSDTGVTVTFNFHEDRAMVTYPGAMNELCCENITDQMLEEATHLHVSSIFLQPALKPGLENLFRRARQKGLTTSMDPQWDPTEEWDLNKEKLLPEIDIFLPNLEELKNITGQSTIENCLNTIQAHSNIVVVKNGRAGARLQKEAITIEQEAFLNTDIVDTIGAGDSFNAGFIHSYLQGKPLQECMRVGALCGAINTTGSGGTTAFDNYDNLIELAMQKFNTCL